MTFPTLSRAELDFLGGWPRRLGATLSVGEIDAMIDWEMRLRKAKAYLTAYFAAFPYPGALEDVTDLLGIGVDTLEALRVDLGFEPRDWNGVLPGHWPDGAGDAEKAVTAEEAL